MGATSSNLKPVRSSNRAASKPAVSRSAFIMNSNGSSAGATVRMATGVPAW